MAENEFKHKLVYKELIEESHKAYYVLLTKRIKKFIPKSQSVLVAEEKTLYISDWLYGKFQEEEKEKQRKKAEKEKKLKISKELSEKYDKIIKPN
jgi:hypothetical protein